MSYHSPQPLLQRVWRFESARVQFFRIYGRLRSEFFDPDRAYGKVFSAYRGEKVEEIASRHTYGIGDMQ